MAAIERVIADGAELGDGGPGVRFTYECAAGVRARDAEEHYRNG